MLACMLRCPKIGIFRQQLCSTEVIVKAKGQNMRWQVFPEYSLGSLMLSTGPSDDTTVGSSITPVFSLTIR